MFHPLVKAAFQQVNRNLKDFREIETTADKLCRALYGKSVDILNLGVYEGTEIPLRKVPSTAPVRLMSWSGGGRVQDDQGGWIADRFGPHLGHREAKKAMLALT